MAGPGKTPSAEELGKPFDVVPLRNQPEERASWTARRSAGGGELR